MKIAPISLLLAVLPFVPSLADDPGTFLSPDKSFAIKIVPATGSKEESYAVLETTRHRKLSECPQDGRYRMAPVGVVWSADSKLVAVDSQLVRHGGQPDIWKVSKGKAIIVKATFPNDEGDFYYTPKRWLNATDLECSAFGKLKRSSAPDPENPFKSYTLVMRIDLKTGSAKVISTSKPDYGHF